jgi:hypothetical protein
LAEATRYIPAQMPSWCWCPGSSNMFRRALLDRIRPIDSSRAVFGGVDGFFTPILHALTGTLLVDQPLSAYRVHGANDCSMLPSLTGINGARPEVEAQSSAIFSRALIWLVDHIDDIMAIAAPPSRYWQILDTVMSTDPRREGFSRPELKPVLARQYPRLIALFGARRVHRELRRHMRFSDLLAVVLAARKHHFAIADFGGALSFEIIRAVRRLRTFVRNSRT